MATKPLMRYITDEVEKVNLHSTIWGTVQSMFIIMPLSGSPPLTTFHFGHSSGSSVAIYLGTQVVSTIHPFRPSYFASGDKCATMG